MFKSIQCSYSEMSVEDRAKLMEQRSLESYIRYKDDVHNVSYWFPKIKDCGFKVPETVVMPLDFEDFKWLREDGAKEEKDIIVFGNKIKNYLEVVGFNVDRDLFIKNGTYSGKFEFDWCKVVDINTIANKFLSISYDSMVVGAGNSTELVVREYIKAKEERPKIYNGMPLNTEFRVFYDFDKGKVLGTFNYWDKNVMSDSLNPVGRYIRDEEHKQKLVTEYTNYKNTESLLEQEFESLKDSLECDVLKNMSTVKGLKGIWSIDFMYVDGVMYLIDMALGNRSYYWNRVAVHSDEG